MPTAPYRIAILPGDGIGPEVIDSGVQVIDAIAGSLGIQLEYTTYAAGAELYRQTGESISVQTMEAIGHADAIFLGAMGLPDVRKSDGTELAPQIDIREHYGLFASLRPSRSLPGVPTRVNADSINMLIIRETTEGLFAGRHDKLAESDEEVSDRLTITRNASERLFELAFQQASARRETDGTPGHVTLFDKANVLRSNAFLRTIFDEVAARFPGVTSERLYVDAGSMMLVTQPERFDVIVTENVFGDITSEVAAGVVGGLGVAPSADVSLTHAVFQPCHGTAPDIAGLNRANPIAAILSAAMLLDWLAERHQDKRCFVAAAAIREAVSEVLANGAKTPDIGGTATTQEVTAAVAAAVTNATTSV